MANLVSVERASLALGTAQVLDGVSLGEPAAHQNVPTMSQLTLL